MRKHVKLFTLVMALLLAVSFLSAAAAVDNAVAEKALSIASNCAKQLDGAWGDKHAAMIESKKGAEFADYESMRAVLSKLLAGSGAVYMYALYPSGAVDSAPFFITVDGSEEPDEYGTANDWETGFAAAWKGVPTAADEAEEDDDAGLLLSAYAPVHDSKGNVVAILGVDYPAK